MKHMKLRIASIAVSAALGLAVSTAGAADLTFAPAESLLWSTVVDTAPAVSVFWPPEAASAELVVVDGKSVTTNAVALGTTSVSLSLPRPAKLAEERVVNLTLLFYDSDGKECVSKRQTAKLGVALTGAAGESARFAVAGSRDWGSVRDRTALLPVPAAAAFDDLPCRWWFLTGLPTSPTEVSFLDGEGETLCAAEIWRLAPGFSISFK